MTDPTYSHDAQQAAQDAAGDVAASIQDAIDAQDIFQRANVKYTHITPVSEGVVRVETTDHFKQGALERLFKAMGAEDNWNSGAFAVRWEMDGKGGQAWVLTRRAL